MSVEDYRDLLAAAAKARGLNPPAIVQPADHYAILNGIRLHYLDWGNPHLPHVVLLHGGGLTAHTWDMTALLLRDRYHFIALDFRGNGDSDWSPDVADDVVRTTVLVDDTIAFLEYLDLPRFSLVGMSRGGIVGTRCAARFAERLDAFVLVDIAPATTNAPVGGAGRPDQIFDSPEQALAELGENGRSPIDYLRYSLFHSLHQLPDGRWGFKEDRRPRPRLPEEEWKAAVARERDELQQAVHSIRTPTLLIRGESSKVLSDEDARRTVEMMSDIQYVVVPDAGHSVQTNNPKRFVEVLDAFLSERLPKVAPPAAAPQSTDRSSGPSLNYDGAAAHQRVEAEI